MSHPSASTAFRSRHISRVAFALGGSAPGLFLARDISRRTVALASPADGSALKFYTTADGGHSFSAVAIPGTDGGQWPCLALAPTSGRLAAFYAKAGSIYQTTAAADGETAGHWSTPWALWSGDYCTLAVNGPRWALVYVSAGTLTLRASGDSGRTWDAAETITTGVDLSSGGRPAAARSGENLLVAVADTGALTLWSKTGGTWSGATIASVAATNLTLLTLPGVLLLASRESAAPVLRRSVNGGAAWTVEATPPPSDSQYALGLAPHLSRLLWGLTHFSGDDGGSWSTD